MNHFMPIENISPHGEVFSLWELLEPDSHNNSAFSVQLRLNRFVVSPIVFWLLVVFENMIDRVAVQVGYLNSYGEVGGRKEDPLDYI